MTPPTVRSERLELTPLAAPAVDALLARDRGALERLTGGRFEDPSPPPYMADALPVVSDRLRQAPAEASWWNWLVIRSDTFCRSILAAWRPGAPGTIRPPRDPLLGSMFHATGQPARAQIGGRSRCPWVTAGDRSLPSVLARQWHGACRTRSRHAAGASLIP